MKKILYAIVMVLVLASFAAEFLYAQSEISRRDADIASLKYDAAVQEQVAKNWMEAYHSKPVAAQAEEVQSIVAVPTNTLAPLPTLSLPTPTPTIVPVIVPTEQTYLSIPPDATAACKDGTFYYKHDYKHVCQGHGGYWWWKYAGCTKDSC